MTDIAQRLAALSPEQREMLAQRLKQKGALAPAQTPSNGKPNGTQPIPTAARDGALPLSFAQQRLWFLHQIEPDSPFYNVLAAFRMAGALDLAALQRSFRSLIARHESLRTTFVTLDGRAQQVIAPSAGAQAMFGLRLVDLSALDEAARETATQRLADQAAQQPFDLAVGPLMRCVVLRQSASEHTLLLTMHHIVCDEWSVEILFRELSALYGADLAGRAATLPALPIQYADFAAWQRQWLNGPVLESQLGYWKRQLSGLAALDLPTDRPRPAVQSFQGADYTFTLPAALLTRLHELSQREGATLFMTLLAAYQTLLARYSRQDDIAVGVPIAGRTHADIEGLIGFFVNTLVFRSDLSGNPGFRELVGRVREVALGAYAHQDVPFEKLVEELQPQRDLSRPALFQVMFVFDKAGDAQLALPNVRLDPLAITRGTAKFDLTLTLQETGHGLNALLEYNTDLFDTTTIVRLAEHFRTLLEGIASQPERRIAELPLLTADERHLMLETWNATQADYPHDRCFHELFEEQVARTPDALAVFGEQERLTYAELDQRANQLAWQLQSLGVGPDVPVGVCLKRAPSLVVALLGVLKAGGAYVPLDPAYPQDRLAYMLDDAQVKVLITATQDAGRRTQDAGGVRPVVIGPSSFGGQVLDLDADWALIARQPVVGPATTVRPDNLAYVLYTSGSTGRPKGVLIPQRGLVNYLSWATRTYAIAQGQGAPVHSSIAFDLTITGLFGPLLTGRSVQLLAADSDATSLTQTIDGPSPLSLVKLTPAHLELLGQQVAPADAAGWTNAFIIGGEPLLARQLAFWQAAAPATRLVNEYGPTEAVVGCVVYEVSPERPILGTIPIGRPTPNTTIYLLDAHMQPVPVGVPGEVYIGGAQLARGYLGRPDLTAERFVPNPFATLEDEGRPTNDEPAVHPVVRRPSSSVRLYKTGDLARYLPDGNIEYLGRIDHQVKIRGFRIELGEIAAVLDRHPAVREATVLAREDVPGQRRLVAYVVPAEADRRTANDEAAASSSVPRPSSFITELRDHLGQTLPEYMLPSAFVLLDALPLTTNGKVDRRALPAPEQARPDQPTSFVAARTPAEAQLAQIWAQTLGIAQVGVNDNFFALGGDSILSIQIVVRANQAGLRITPKQMFQHQTIAGLAAVAGTALVSVAEQGLVRGPVPLTPIQRWFLARDLPDPQHYNQSLLLETRRPLDPRLLEQAARSLVAHHDALRLRFSRAASGWQQISSGMDTQPVVVAADLSALPATAQATAITALAAQAQASLNLAHGPLLRVVLFDLGSDQPGRLLLAINHMAVDAVSWPIIVEDLQAAYTQLNQGRAVALPRKTSAFKQWAERLTSYAQTDSARAEAGYWLALAGRQVARLPVDHAAGTNTLASAREVVVALGADETHALLHQVPEVYRTQINDVLLTALVQAFARWTGTRSLLVDLEGHGREDLFDDLDISRTVGWFTALFPVLLDLQTASGPGAALKTIKEHLRQVPRHGVGYGVLRYLSDEPLIADALGALPAAEVSFNYLGQSDQSMPAGLFAEARESSGPTSSPRGLRSHLLEIIGSVAEGRLQLSWTYSAAIHDRATIAGLAHAYLAALRALIAHCRAPEAGGFTPADFPLARLDQAALDGLVGQDRQIDDIYPLAPLQQGLLFHTVSAAESGVYVTQTVVGLRGALDAAALRRAWQQVVDNHAIFRTAFAWQGLETPLQLVRKSVGLPWHSEDWRMLAADEQEAQMQAFLADERRRGFDLGQAPLMRLALFQVADDAHRLVWTNHHLLLDGWSTPLVLDEVFSSYAAFARGQAPERAQPQPYRDYIAWLQQQDLSQAEAFWRRTLAGFTTPTPLDIGRPSGASAGATGPATQIAALAGSTTAALQALARQHGLTLNTLVQGAWALLLSRYSGEQDVVFGATVAGRPPELAGVETMIGMFINTLPVRVRIAPNATLLGWLAQLQEQQVELRQYEYSPLVQVQSWSDVPRGRSLFESIMAFENYPVSAAAAEQSDHAGLVIEDVAGVEQINYPLGMTAWLDPALTLRFSYDQARFDGATIQRMLGHLRTLLEGIASRPGQRVADLPLLTAAEQHLMHVTWNATETSYPQERCFHELFAAQAAETPAALAVIFGQEHLTYAELDQRANQLAHHLQALGVGPDVLVGLSMERSTELVIGLLAVLKAGGAYLPLDPSYPAERLDYMLADAQAGVLLVAARAEAGAQPIVVRGSPFVGQVVDLHAEWPQIAQRPVSSPATTVQPGSLAYVIYTSGSTGRPKGVMLGQRGLVNLTEAQVRGLGVQAGERVLQFASISFDASIFEIVMALRVGATICLAPRTTLLPGPDMLRLLDEQAINVVTLPPSALALLPDAPLRALRLVTVAGEACSPDVIARWAPGRQFYNLYGPTEATVWSTLAACQPGTSQVPPIGTPIANAQVYLLDAHMQPVPIGVPGELYIGGAGLARGYLGRPDLTAERFVPNPFATPEDERRKTNDETAAGPVVLRPSSFVRLYRSGDLARYRADGNIEFLGRIDHQVKLRGYRIELGEIEARLTEHPQVREAIVLAREDIPGDKRLVAYVVTNDDLAVTNTQAAALVNPPTSLASELRSQLKAALPDYMLPADYVILAALPLTPNGKVDRRALPAPDSLRGDLAATFVAPQTEAEQTIAAIWRQVLHIDEVGVNDNFFDLGGHSLHMLRIYNELRAAFSKDIAMIEMFRLPTISALAGYFAQGPNEQALADQTFKSQDRAIRKIEALNRKSQLRKKVTI